MASDMLKEEKTAVTISRETLKRIQDVQFDVQAETRQRMSQEAVILLALDALNEKRERHDG